MAIQQDSKFTTLDETLQSFVRNVAGGQKRIEDLLATQEASIKAHTTDEVVLQAVSIKCHVTSEITKAQMILASAIDEKTVKRSEEKIEKDAYEKLLKSLRYEGRDERRNQIIASHSDTFEWIFQSMNLAKPLRYVNSKGQLVDSSAATAHKQDNRDPSPDDLHTCGPNSTTEWDCFACWLTQPPGQPYWFCGKAGSGKSTLVKFVVENGKTRSCLEATYGPTIILEHFIWLVGQPIQRSMRGILLSLLYQFVRQLYYPHISKVVYDQPQFQEAMHLLFVSGSKTADKESPPDWSYEELQAGLMAVLHASPKMVCIFLDGLDEVESELLSPIPKPVLDLVDKLCALPGVKVCVSSRPEPAFRVRFSSCRQLALQNLIRDDIMKYVIDHVRPCVPYASGTEEEVYMLARKLWKCSDGVFLWVCLVTKSFLIGLTNGDTVPELLRRLDLVPRDINKLYESMWQRLGEDDRDIYQQEAAVYVNLMLDWTSGGKGNNKYEWHNNSLGYFSATHYFVAMHSEYPWRFFRNREKYSHQENQRLAQNQATRIETRTAGLLEARKTEDGDIQIAFLHRSAQEFFTNTEPGRELLKHDTTPNAKRLFNLFNGAIFCLWLKFRSQGLGLAEIEQWLHDLQSNLLSGTLDLVQTLTLCALCQDIHRKSYRPRIRKHDLLTDYGLKVTSEASYRDDLQRSHFDFLLVGIGCGTLLSYTLGRGLNPDDIAAHGDAPPDPLHMVISNSYKTTLFCQMVEEWDSKNPHPEDTFKGAQYLLRQHIHVNKPEGFDALRPGPAATILINSFYRNDSTVFEKPWALRLLRQCLLLDEVWEEKLVRSLLQFDSVHRKRLEFETIRFAVRTRIKTPRGCFVLVAMPMTFATALFLKRVSPELQSLPEYTELVGELQRRCPSGPPPARIRSIRFGKYFKERPEYEPNRDLSKVLLVPSDEDATLPFSLCSAAEDNHLFHPDHFSEKLRSIKRCSVTTADELSRESLNC